jgi:hypothetical protein
MNGSLHELEENKNIMSSKLTLQQLESFLWETAQWRYDG